MKKINWLLFILPLLFACGNNKTKDKAATPEDATIEADTTQTAIGSYFFSGDFTDFENTPTFKDCITGAVIPVVNKGAYKEVKKKYHRLDLNDSEGVYCQIMGYLINNPAESKGDSLQIVITSLIQFDRTAACHTEHVTNTMYSTYLEDKKDTTNQISLWLTPDYTFQATAHDLTTKAIKQETKGTWRRTSDENIVLLINGEVYYQGIIDFTNMSLKLNDDNNKLWIFKKTTDRQ